MQDRRNVGRPAPSSGFSGVFNGVNGVLHIKYADRGSRRKKKGVDGEERGGRQNGSGIREERRGAMCVSLMRLLITGHCH